MFKTGSNEIREGRFWIQRKLDVTRNEFADAYFFQLGEMCTTLF